MGHVPYVYGEDSTYTEGEYATATSQTDTKAYTPYGYAEGSGYTESVSDYGTTNTVTNVYTDTNNGIADITATADAYSSKPSSYPFHGRQERYYRYQPWG